MIKRLSKTELINAIPLVWGGYFVNMKPVIIRNLESRHFGRQYMLRSI